MESVKEKEHLLELKVMRLTRPSLYSTRPLACEPHDLAGMTLGQEIKNDIGAPLGLEQLSCGNLLMLPQSFGTIYLGETFSCYMSVHNDSTVSVYDAHVMADLQTSTQKLPLSTGKNNHKAVLAPDESVDDVIHYEVKECGTHILVCSVSYKNEAKETLYFRKFFKFKVLKPLDVKTKFYNAESDQVYLETQLQNTTSSPICLEKVSLEPSPHFMSTDLNLINNKSVFGTVNCLAPNNIRQYLFCLTPRPETRANVKLLNGLSAIGKLDIVWRSAMGEKGRIQTSQLERMAPGYGDIQVSVDSLPSLATLEKPIHVTLRITNTSERPMELVLEVDNQAGGGVLWQGLSSTSLGRLEPEKSLSLRLEAIPVHCGLQMLSGIRFTDPFLNRKYQFDDLAQVFVSPSQEVHQLAEVTA